MALYRFGAFELDGSERRLSLSGVPVDCHGRYLDALLLLVGEAGRLVTKERFFNEVWRGVPVTDEALTQCIRSLRRTLGDDAQAPRFIETVPKHGYRFVAAVQRSGPTRPADRQAAVAEPPWPWLVGAGTVGAGLAGLVGGLLYGFAAASQPPPGAAALSAVLVVTCASILVALLGGAGVSLGIAGAERLTERGSAAAILGGALGGLLVGAVTRLVGLDAFQLLIGQAPGAIAGGIEGLLLGGSVGAAVWWTDRHGAARDLPGRALRAGLAGAAGGAAVALAGGRLMAGSLDALARNVPGSRLSMDALGAFLGEQGFGWRSGLATSVLEGALFAACIVTAMALARRTVGETGAPSESPPGTLRTGSPAA